jgi:branched-chain amino acid transport system substrate-binding protein
MRRLGLLVALGLAIFGVPGSAQAQHSIKVGVLTELSGPLGTLGMAERDGFLLYLKKASGKLGGLTVETVVEDTGNDPATALVKARKLLDSDKIEVLLGPMSSASAAAIKTFVSGRKVPSLVQATVDEVSDNKSMFRTTFPASADSFLQGYLAGKAGFKKATAIAPNFNAGQDAVTWFEKGFEAAGGKVVQKLLPRLGTPDFGSYIAQIDESADVGLVFMAGGDAVRFINRDRRRSNFAGPGQGCTRICRRLVLLLDDRHAGKPSLRQGMGGRLQSQAHLAGSERLCHGASSRCRSRAECGKAFG